MPIIKWAPILNPFEEMDKFFEDFHPSMRSGYSFMPAVDVYEDDKNVIVEAPLPGIDIKNVNVLIEHDVLTIEGKSEKKIEVDEKNYYRKEVSSGSFHRAVALPKAVDGNKAKASYENGILKVAVPKKAEVKKSESIKIAVKNKK